MRFGVGIVVLTTCAWLVSCASEPEIKPKDQVDMTAWKSEVAAQPGALANPDMDSLYEVMATHFCKLDVDQMALNMTLSDADPAGTRTSMNYVCPSRAHLVDEALTQLQETSDSFEQACRTPKNLRTQKQQQALEAQGTCPSR